MTKSDEVLLNAFRSTLPDTHNRDMWVNETYLEYSRLRVLRARGVALRPVEGSLMAMLLSLEGETAAAVEDGEGRDAYKAQFGHSPTYCWFVPFAELELRLASGCGMPGQAWVGGDV